MAQSVIITLTIAGTDTGPFNLYSNVDGFSSPFESSISKSALQAGYLSGLVPDAATVIRVKSMNPVCSNYIDIVITTTTTTTIAPTTTTTTTSDEPTTTTTEAPPSGCYVGTITDNGSFFYTNCSGTPFSGGGEMGSQDCMDIGESMSGNISIDFGDPC